MKKLIKYGFSFFTIFCLSPVFAAAAFTITNNTLDDNSIVQVYDAGSQLVWTLKKGESRWGFINNDTIKVIYVPTGSTHQAKLIDTGITCTSMGAYPEGWFIQFGDSSSNRVCATKNNQTGDFNTHSAISIIGGSDIYGADITDQGDHCSQWKEAVIRF